MDDFMSATYQHVREAALASVRRQLGQHAFESAHNALRHLTLDQAVESTARQPSSGAAVVGARFEARADAVRSLATWRAAERLDNGIGVSGDVHAPF